MKVTVVDISVGLIKAFQEHLNGNFKHLKGKVELKLGSFEELSAYDAIVSPGNSFGFMNGGVDNALRNFFGSSLEKRVMEHIQVQFSGEHNVGSAFVIETKNSKHPWLVHAPTMRVPSVIKGTDSVYSATWAGLLAVDRHNKTDLEKIEHLVFPGMGTGAGKMPLDKAAGQMLLAFDRYFHPVYSNAWKDAYARNNILKEYI